MNRKVIKAILEKKLQDWINSITDDNVKNLVRKNTIVTGGAIASMLLNEKVKDFDVYFKDLETTLAVAHYYVDKFNEKKGEKIAQVLEDSDTGRVKIFIESSGVAADESVGGILEAPFEDAVEEIEAQEVETDERNRYRPIFLSSNAITLTNKIQIVVRFYGAPEEIHENYDFVHCTNYYDFDAGNLVLKPDALECLLTKELRYQGSKYPLCSIIRTRKFIKRGFHINAGQYLKMCFQISNLDLRDVEVLEDQLVGVDSAYFMRLIDALKSKKDSDPNFQITAPYVAEIIERIF